MTTKIKCQYCKKEYSNLYNLNNHQKTAKFCLNIQNQLNTNNNTNNNININILPEEQTNFTCEYCNKSFNLKYNYNVHLSSCKHKKTLETNTKLEEYSKKLEETTNKLKELEKKLEMKELEMLLSIQSKDELIYQLKEQLKNPTTIIHNNNSTNTTTKNTNYNIQYNRMVDKITSNKQDILQKRLQTLNKSKLIHDNENKLTDNFCNHIVNQVKDMVFCTDMSRGNLVMKDEDNKPVKIASEAFVIKCFQKAKKELLKETASLFND